jgi:hypothetical protein
VPDDQRITILQPYIVCSLGTGIRGRAIILARANAAMTDEAFTKLRHMPEKKTNATDLLNDFANDPNCRLRIRFAGAQLRLEDQDRSPEKLEIVNSLASGISQATKRTFDSISTRN